MYALFSFRFAEEYFTPYLIFMKKLFLLLLITLTNYSCSQSIPREQLSYVDTTRIKNDLSEIVNLEKSRNYKNIEMLNKVANYIKTELGKVCDSVAYQSYNVDNSEYKNVIASIGMENKERIIIGAHYDVFGNQQGADDNASGVAGLLELARLLSKEKLTYRIDFVAYTLEEPPFFRTKEMGSYVHAKYLFDNQISIKGMICLETIGYYDEKPNSQDYPIKGMSLVYGNKGDFITVVQNNKNQPFSEMVKGIMKQQNLIETKSFKGSAALPGIDFSDHMNYWKFNYDAVMITNTAFYRNKNYHTDKDKLETLDIQKMSLVIEQLYMTMRKIE